MKQNGTKQNPRISLTARIRIKSECLKWLKELAVQENNSVAGVLGKLIEEHFETEQRA